METKYVKVILALSLCLLLVACTLPVSEPSQTGYETQVIEPIENISLDFIISGDFGELVVPAYSGSPYVELNGNIPFFNEDDFTTETFEYYSDLDSLGRCGVAYANVCQDIMPEKGEKRGEIGQVRPSGWVTATYPEVISDRYLYNRCHLIGWQLCGENANTKNLITGTRYLNIEGMLPFENAIDDYVEETNNHVLYRVTPYYTGTNLVADGVLMEAHSVEDDKLVFCVWAYNVQPYIHINYATGESYQIDTAISGTNSSSVTQSTEVEEDLDTLVFDFVLNTSSMKAHDETCSYAQNMSKNNRQEFSGTFNDVLDMGYSLCKSCFGDKE